MKKMICMLLALALAAGILAGAAVAEGEPLKIVTTIFPIYDWTKAAAGDAGAAEITLLLDSGVDLHSFQPTAADMMKIATCDVFIYVGGESDEWVEDALEEAVNPELTAVCLLDLLGDSVKTEEIVEGMEHEHDHEDGDHDHEEEDHGEEEDHEDGDHDHEHEDEADEHVWLSLRNAEFLSGEIARVLGEKDPEHAAAYQANAEAYAAELTELDRKYQETTGAAAFDTVLFGDRFPFRYLTDDYGLNYYAAFSGCSAETEASFQTIVFLAGKMDELGLPAVLTIEGANHQIAETVVNATAAKNQQILMMNSMQGVTAQDVEAGASYLSIMESNLEILKEALN